MEMSRLSHLVYDLTYKAVGRRETNTRLVLIDSQMRVVPLPWYDGMLCWIADTYTRLRIAYHRRESE
jgi:hypothetical protein